MLSISYNHPHSFILHIIIQILFQCLVNLVPLPMVAYVHLVPIHNTKISTTNQNVNSAHLVSCHLLGSPNVLVSNCQKIAAKKVHCVYLLPILMAELAHQVWFDQSECKQCMSGQQPSQGHTKCVGGSLLEINEIKKLYTWYIYQW